MLRKTARMFFVKKPGANQFEERNTVHGVLFRWLTCLMVGFSFAAKATDPSTVSFAWNPSPDANVEGYRIYYGVAPAQYTNHITVGNLTTGTVSGLVNGVTYYFATTAYSVDGLESPFSNEIAYQPAFSQMQGRMIGTSQMVLTIQGQIGHTYNIEATQDLAVWSVIGTTNVAASGCVEFTDPNSANFARRFYRLRDTTP